MNVIFIKNAPLWEKKSRFGHTSFIKVVINGTIATNVTQFLTRVLPRLLSIQYYLHILKQCTYSGQQHLMCFSDNKINFLLFCFFRILDLNLSSVFHPLLILADILLKQVRTFFCYRIRENPLSRCLRSRTIG